MEILKICTKCRKLLDISCFCKDSTKSDKLSCRCKKCISLWSKEHYVKNRAIIIKRTAAYKKARRKPRVLLTEEEKKLRYKASKARHWAKHRETEIKRNSLYKQNRIKTDPLFKLRHRVSTLISGAIRKQKFKKQSKTSELLGCSYEETLSHLIETAIRNYGSYSGDLKDYHIDHIIPCSTAKSEQDLFALQHFTNLQLLTPTDNLKKSNKLLIL